MPRRSPTPIVVIALVVAAFAVGAQEPEVPPIYLTFAVYDYLSLYPEADYGNPAVILQLDRPVLLNGAYFTGSNNSLLETHTIDYAGLGAADGTSSSTSHSSTNRIGVDGFFPIGDSIGTGFGAMVDLGFDRVATELIDWDAADQLVTTEEADHTQAWDAAGYFAYRLGDLDLGARLGFAGSHDPWSAEWTSDASVIAGVPYLTAFTDPNRTLVWNPQVNLGGIYRLQSFTLGLAASFAWIGVRTTPHVGVDKDADTYNEAVVTEEEYQTTTAAWAAGPHPEYNWKDQSDEFVVVLSPSMIWQASPKLAVVATGSVRALDTYSEVQYEHLDGTDLTVDRQDVSRPFASLTAGVAFAPVTTLRMRTGIGYLMSGLRQTDNSLDATGASPFAAANTGHYPEVNWPAEPNNGRVANVVNTNTDTFRSTTHAVRALASLEYRPAPTVLLFGGAAAGYAVTIDTYRVFNIADSAVWEEREFNGEFGVDYSLLLGVGVYVSSDTFVGVRTGTGSIGSLGYWDELPTSGGTASIGGQGGYDDFTNHGGLGGWSIDLYCVVGL